MNNNQPFNKRSLGHLRPAPKTKLKSPDALGQIRIQRQTMENLIQQMSDESDAVVVANIACWRNKDKDGHYLTVELSPKYQKRNERPTPDGLLSMFNEERNDD